MNFRRSLLLIVTVLASRSGAFGADEIKADMEFFEKRIRPVLIRECYECHSAAAADVKGGLRLDSRDLMRQGGDSGPAVVPGRVDRSLLLEALRHESFEMPPDRKLPDSVISDFEKWIALGAPDPRDQPPSAEEVSALSWQSVLDERRHWWSLQPVVATEPPVTPGVETIHPIDAFVTAKQQVAEIRPAGQADTRVLARRLSLVLTGLPPESAEVEQFVRDSERDSEAAYEAFVDRLLDSPHFGEHWARHWMDVVRFAETHGYEWNHEIRDAWRYRDYLIRAFNRDLPYDQLIREHIAGDLLENPRWNRQLDLNESLIGTAFWRFGELGHDDCVEFPEIRFDALDNQIDTLAKAFQGLTLSCARCHDHKVDAMSMRDYYALVGVLESCSQVVHTLDSPQRIADVVARTQQLKRQLRRQLGRTWLAAVDQSQAAIQQAIQTDGENATPLAEYIANEKLDLSDPGYMLGRLARRDAGADSESTADTSDLRNAHWLWYPEGNATVDAPIETRYFRRRIVIPEDRRVTQAVCFFAGDDSVTLYVNGRSIGTGNGHPMLVSADITSRLTTGANELAVANRNKQAPVKQNPGGWIGVIRIEFDLGDPLLFYSDANWKTSRTAGEGWQTGSFADDQWVAAKELGKAGIGPWGYPWPQQSPVRREVDLASLWPILKQEYAAEQSRRAKANAENFELWSDFGSSETSDWSTSGLGLSHGPSRPGEFTLTHAGDQVVAAVLPAGLYTHVTSDRLNGSLRSPWVPTQKKYISVQLVGDGRSMVRPVVDTCGLNEFAGGGLEYLAGGVTKWKRLPTTAGDAHRSFIELTTRSDNPRWPDRPGRAGTNDPKELDSPRSSFGVMRAVLHDSPATPQPELNHILALFRQPGIRSAADIAAIYQAVARNAVQAWKDNRATDADVLWLDWLLKTQLLPNSTQCDQQIAELLNRYRALEATIPAPRVIAGLADQGQSKGFPVLKGGDSTQPLAVVPARYLEVISNVHPFETGGSGRRELAETIADADNPLTARVMVNRVWHHLFGRGIVSTPDDFGGMGELPTHPELLDFLASGFAKDGWSTKRLIRRIVLSRTFRQLSLSGRQAADRDPGNQLLHHYPARRLDAESLRDTILTVSGRLDSKLFGPSIHPHRNDEKDYRKLWSGPLDGDGRRSIYTRVTRMEGPQFLELFDFPNPMSTRGRRDRTNVPAQALALLNDPFVIDQAKFWAEQLVAAGHDSIEERVQDMFRRALGRSPDATELDRFVALIRQLAGETSAPDADLLKNTSVWQDAAHAMFNMKELVYIR
ncbi:MAG: DUF1553 domain-containing protein [Planctomycetota bacterium]|jgi:hypothetical protein